MNTSTSIYLDFIRFSSALLVCFYHASFLRFDGAWLKGIGAFGHDAVIIFFVLSGFVIGYVSQEREKSSIVFFLNRFSRLYSVVIPALILTLVLDYIGQQISPAMYNGRHYEDSDPFFRLISNLFFVNEIWFAHWRAFSNGPFWSLSYEFWYYVIFAAYFYFRGSKRLILTGIAVLIAGPKIMLLFPTWLLGYWLFTVSNKIKLNSIYASICVFLPIVIYSFYRYYDIDAVLLGFTIGAWGEDFVINKLYLSRYFINDYLVALLLVVHLIGVISVSEYMRFTSVFTRVVRYGAGITFSLYLFHYPLFQFFGSIEKNSVVMLMLSFLTIALLAPYTEGKKKFYLGVFTRIFEKLGANK